MSAGLALRISAHTAHARARRSAVLGAGRVGVWLDVGS